MKRQKNENKKKKKEEKNASTFLFILFLDGVVDREAYISRFEKRAIFMRIGVTVALRWPSSGGRQILGAFQSAPDNETKVDSR